MKPITKADIFKTKLEFDELFLTLLENSTTNEYVKYLKRINSDRVKEGLKEIPLQEGLIALKELYEDT